MQVLGTIFFLFDFFFFSSFVGFLLIFLFGFFVFCFFINVHIFFNMLPTRAQIQQHLGYNVLQNLQKRVRISKLQLSNPHLKNYSKISCCYYSVHLPFQLAPDLDTNTIELSGYTVSPTFNMKNKYFIQVSPHPHKR